MLRKRLLIGLTVIALMGAACGGDDEGSSSEGTTETGGGGGSVTLTAADIKFDPTELSAAVGDSIEFVNEDNTEHNFTAEDAGIDEDADASSSVTIDLTDVEAGSYDFVCEYHPDTMTGTLEVTE